MHQFLPKRSTSDLASHGLMQKSYDAKSKRRKLERIWRKSKTSPNVLSLKQQRNATKKLITLKKADYYNSLIENNQNDQRFLFKTFRKILNKPNVVKYPEPTQGNTLANEFAEYFKTKMDKISSSFKTYRLTRPLQIQRTSQNSVSSNL